MLWSYPLDLMYMMTRRVSEMTIVKFAGCRQCPLRDDDYNCSEGGQRIPFACRPSLHGQPGEPHKVPDWCPVLDATIRGRHVLGYQIRTKPAAGKSWCQFVFCEGAQISERHVPIENW